MIIIPADTTTAHGAKVHSLKVVLLDTGRQGHGQAGHGPPGGMVKIVQIFLGQAGLVEYGLQIRSGRVGLLALRKLRVLLLLRRRIQKGYW